jgi:crossover junction endodeoxyribonuclease RuvC
LFGVAKHKLDLFAGHSGKPLQEVFDPRSAMAASRGSRMASDFALVRLRVYHQGRMTQPIRILGIDPGLRRTGWGVVEVDGNRLSYVACGSLATDDQAALAVRLVTIHDGLVRVVADFRPDEAAAEATFVNRDASATLKLGQARGVALLVPAKAGVPVAEYAPNLVKKTIVGAGHGDKAQIRMMIGVLLPKAAPQSEDAADALAVAVTHAHHRQSALARAMAR